MGRARYGLKLGRTMQELEVSFVVVVITIANVILLIEEDTRDRGKLYKPQSRLTSSQDSMNSAEKAQAYARLLAADKKPERFGKRKQTVKSNLESFKEELRQYVGKLVFNSVGNYFVVLGFKRREKRGTSTKGR